MLNNSYEANKSSSYESLSKFQQAELDTFIFGLIKGCMAYNEDNKFTVPDLVGRDSFGTWKNTPLNYIYQYHKHRECDDPEAEAGKDVGRIFKYVMAKDKIHKYEIVDTSQRQFPVNVYKLIK